MGGPNRQGDWKKFRNLVNGVVEINGDGWNLRKGFKLLYKEQKQVVIKHRAKIYTAAPYFAIKIGCKLC